jgi:Tfp pilus assembly protein PilV
MKITQINPRKPGLSSRGSTLVEIVMAVAVSTLAFSGIIMGLTTTCQRAEWASYNLAAQNLAQQGIEQARAAKWDPQASTPVDNCVQTNFPSVGTNILDVPLSGTNITYATNVWTITTVSSDPYPLKMIRVDTTWRYQRPGRPSQVFTNTVATLRAPNQ